MSEVLGKEPFLLISEAEKGLRSPRIGNQCEAVSAFWRVIIRFPHAIIINTVLLKISDAFVASANNLLRFLVFRLLAQCSAHISLFTNVDSLLKRFLTTLESDDGTARAISLRVFGILAPLLHNRLDIITIMAKALRSPEATEQLSALRALTAVCQHLPQHCVAVFDHVVETIHDPLSSSLVELKSMGMLRHFHHASICDRALSECDRLLETHPSQPHVVVLLNTLCCIVCRSLSSVSWLSDRLSPFALIDARAKVQCTALQCFQHLLRHPLTDCHVPFEEIVDLAAADVVPRNVRHHALLVLRGASLSPLCDLHGRPTLLSNLQILIYSSDFGGLVCEILSNIMKHMDPSVTRVALADEVVDACTVLLNTTPSVLSSLPSLATMCSGAVLSRLVCALVQLLCSHPSSSLALRHCILALCTNCEDARALVTQIIQERSAQSPQSGHKDMFDVLVRLSTSETRASIEPHVLSLLDGLKGRGEVWELYRALCGALTHKLSSVTMPYLEILTDLVDSEQHWYWMRSVSQLAAAEHILVAQQGHVDSALLVALNSCGISLKAASSTTTQLTHQQEYIALRTRLSTLFFTLLGSLKCSNDCVAPTIQTSLTAELEAVRALRFSRFGMDSTSQSMLNDLCILVTTLSHCVALMNSSTDPTPSLPPSLALAFCRNPPSSVSSICSAAVAEAATRPSTERWIHIVATLSLAQQGIPPLFFNTSKQPTIKVSLTPTPKSGEPLVLPAHVGSCLILEGRFENVLSEKRIASIVLQVSLQPSSVDLAITNTTKSTNTVTLTAQPQSQPIQVTYFCQLPCAGTYTLTVLPSFCDHTGALWSGGAAFSQQIKGLPQAGSNK